MIAITGASGNLGKAVLSFLLKKTNPENIVAIVRDPDKLKNQEFRGINIRKADYNDPVALNQAMHEVKKVLLISSSAMGTEAAVHEQNVINAAAKNKVGGLIYTSTLYPKADAYFLAAAVCRGTEDYIKKSGIKHIIFRNSMYMETIPLFIGSAMEDGQIYYPSSDGKVSFVSRFDIAEALSNLLIATHTQNATYSITGTEALNFTDIALLLKEVKGIHNAKHHQLSLATYYDTLNNYGMPADEVEFYLSMAKSIAANEFENIDVALQHILKREPLVLKQWLKEN